MNIIKKSAITVVKACEGCPVTTTILVIMFVLLFNTFEATIETLIFGKRLEHFLDVVFQASFIAYASYCVYLCSVFHKEKHDLLNNSKHG